MSDTATPRPTTRTADERARELTEYHVPNVHTSKTGRATVDSIETEDGRTIVVCAGCGQEYPCDSRELADMVLRAALAAQPAPGLDAAWAEAEMALPKRGRWVLSLTRPDRPEITGWNARAFDRDAGYNLAARRRAWDKRDPFAWRKAENIERDFTVYGPTPAAALLALAARLSKGSPDDPE